MANFTFVQGGGPVAAQTSDLQNLQLPADSVLQPPGTLGAFTLATQQMKYDPSILEDNLSGLAGTIATLQGNVQTLQSTSNQHNQNIGNLQSQVSTLQSQVSALQSELATLTGRINAYNGTGPIP